MRTRGATRQDWNQHQLEIVSPMKKPLILIQGVKASTAGVNFAFTWEAVNSENISETLISLAQQRNFYGLQSI